MAWPAWVVSVIVSAVISVAAIIIQPKPKTAKSEAAREGEAPVADAGKPMAVIFGEPTITEPNVLWYGDMSVREYKVKV